MSRKTSDIVIVGGGVIGMAVAYFLSKSTDASITVLDIKKRGNASWASAGGLWPIGESVGLGCGVIFFKTLSRRRRESGDTATKIDRPHQLPEFFLDFCLKSNAMFPELWRELREASGVDFKLEATGLKFIMYDQDDANYAHQIADSIPHVADQLRWFDQKQLREDEPYVTKDAIGALTFLRDDQVNPYLLTLAYREGARRNGVNLIESTEVIGVGIEANRVISVLTKKESIRCSLMINAGGAWAGQIGEMAGVSIPTSPVKGQIVLSERVPRILQSCMSTSDCYLAQKDNGEILIGSTTEDKGFDTSVSYPQIKELCQGAVKAIPHLANLNIKRTWAGLRPGTPDEIPILGPVEGLDGYINACGHFRTGILTSAITGEIIQKIMQGKPSPVPLGPFLLNRFANDYESKVKNKPSELLIAQS
jgi:hydrogen cyanide synthase HcnC